MSQAKAPDDRTVEEKVRQILAPFDRHLERGNTVMASVMLLVPPTTFMVLWLFREMDGKRALGWAICAFGAIFVLGVAWNWLVVRFACWRFDRHFPPDSPARAVAVRILMEMEPPTLAEEKLRRALAHESPRMAYRPDATEAQPPLNTAPVPPPPPPASPEPTPERRPGGYYDYIPLEPRIADEDRPGERGG